MQGINIIQIQRCLSIRAYKPKGGQPPIRDPTTRKPYNIGGYTERSLQTSNSLSSFVRRSIVKPPLPNGLRSVSLCCRGPGKRFRQGAHHPQPLQLQGGAVCCHILPQQPVVPQIEALWVRTSACDRHPCTSNAIHSGGVNWLWDHGLEHGPMPWMEVQSSWAHDRRPPLTMWLTLNYHA